MIYEKDTMEDGTVYERYEGESEEIENLINSLETDDDNLVYDLDEAAEYIDENIIGLYGDTKKIIREILELEEDYMRIKGIIED